MGVAKDTEQPEPPGLTGGVWRATAKLGKGPALPYKTEHTPTLWPGDSTPKCLPNRNQNPCPQKVLEGMSEQLFSP